MEVTMYETAEVEVTMYVENVSTQILAERNRVFRARPSPNPPSSGFRGNRSNVSVDSEQLACVACRLDLNILCM